MNLNKEILFSHHYLSKIFSKLSFTPKIIDIDNIRCQKNKSFSNFCGFGGKHIEFFPPYKFFKEYLKQPKVGIDQFASWYYKIFVIYASWKIPKIQGGMLKGSLYRTVKFTFDKRGLKINKNTLIEKKNLVESLIKKRIKHYFDIFESIRKDGFIVTSQRLMAIKKNNLYYLLNGHHRVSMLAVLGYKKVEILKRTLFNIITENLVLKIKKLFK